MSDQYFKFKGGVWLGNTSVTWPFGRLEINPDQLIISIEGLPFNNSKIERRFTHNEIEKIEIKKYFPIIGYGIHIVAKDKKLRAFYIFGIVAFILKSY